MSEGEGNSPLQIMIMLVLRSLVIVAFIVAFYALASIISSFLGKEIVIEEEVVIIEEDDEGDTAEKEKTVTSGRRDKKKRQ